MLGVGDFLEREFADVVPVLHVLGLAQQGDGCLSAEAVVLGHVEVIDEVDQLDLATGPVLFAGLFDQLLFQHVLQVLTVGVVVEVDDLEVVLVHCIGQGRRSHDFPQHSQGQGSLTTARVTNQQHWMLHVQVPFDEFTCRHCFTSRHCDLVHHHLITIEFDLLDFGTPLSELGQTIMVDFHKVVEDSAFGRELD